MLVLSAGPDPLTAVGFSADGWFVYGAVKENRITRFSTDGSQSDFFSKDTVLRDIRHLAFSPISSDILGMTSSKLVHFSERYPNGSVDIPVPPNGHGLTSCAVVTPYLIALGSGFAVERPVAGFFRLLTLPEGKERGPAISEKGGVKAIAVHQSTQTVAWATGHREIAVWEIAKPDRVRMSFQQTATALAFSPDGLVLAAAMQWNVTLLDWKLKREKAICKGHKGRVTSVAYTPDGNLMTASWDGTVKSWDATGREMRSLDFQQGRLTCLAISPDGTRAAVGTDRGTVLIWDLL